MLNSSFAATPFDRLVAITLQRAGEVAIKMDEICVIIIDGFCIYNDELCIENDDLNTNGQGCIFDTDPSGVDSISFEKHLLGYANVSNSERSFPYQQCVDGAGHDQTCKPGSDLQSN